MMVLYGVVGGFGLGLVYLPAVISVGHYFESKEIQCLIKNKSER